MADELKHKAVGPELTQAEYEALDGHDPGPEGSIVKTVSGQAKWVTSGAPFHGDNDHDGTILSGPIASRPAAGVADRFYWATDEHILYRDTGAAWVKAAAVDHADLDGSGTDDHHAQAHAIGGADHSGGITDAQHGSRSAANAHGHGDLSGVGVDDHHAQAHTVASHSDTNATGAQLDTLVDGGENALHSHELPLQFIPGGQPADSNEAQLLIPMYKDNSGKLDRAALVNVEGLSTVGVIELRRVNNNWVHDGQMARDPSVTLGFTVTNFARITAFAIDSPGSSTKRVVFIHGYHDETDPTVDSFKMDSLELTDKAASVSKVAVTIAGANPPPAKDNGTAITIPLSTSRVLTIVEDDVYFGDITGDETGFTFTYADAPVTGLSANLNPYGSAFNGIRVGNQIMLIVSSPEGPYKVWELATDGTLVDEFSNVLFGWMAPGLGAGATHPSHAWAIDGEFAVAVASTVAGWGYTSNYIAVKAPLNDLVDN